MEIGIENPRGDQIPRCPIRVTGVPWTVNDRIWRHVIGSSPPCVTSLSHWNAANRTAASSMAAASHVIDGAADDRRIYARRRWSVRNLCASIRTPAMRARSHRWWTLRRRRPGVVGSIALHRSGSTSSELAGRRSVLCGVGHDLPEKMLYTSCTHVMVLTTYTRRVDVPHDAMEEPRWLPPPRTPA